MPEAQIVSLWAPSGQYVFAGHFVQVRLPAAAKYPAGQHTAAAAPLALATAQGRQSKGEVFPLEGLYFPAEQLVQEAAPLEENIPAGHV